jgi:hypothetical protein
VEVVTGQEQKSSNHDIWATFQFNEDRGHNQFSWMEKNFTGKNYLSSCHTDMMDILSSPFSFYSSWIYSFNDIGKPVQEIIFVQYKQTEIVLLLDRIALTVRCRGGIFMSDRHEEPDAKPD